VCTCAPCYAYLSLYTSIKISSHDYINLILCRNETSLVSLQVVSDGERVQNAIHGRDYKLRAYLSKSDGKKRTYRYTQN
jgi:hypothetical protein